MTRDARLIPATDPEYRARAADPDSLNIETEDDPPDIVERDVDEKVVSREKQKNVSDLVAEPTVDIHAPKE